MTTHTIDTTNSAGCSPCTPEAHQRADLKTEDEMKSVLNTFRAELFGHTHDLESALMQYDIGALKLLSGRLRYIANRADEIRGR
jgi:hypothetical protein